MEPHVVGDGRTKDNQATGSTLQCMVVKYRFWMEVLSLTFLASDRIDGKTLCLPYHFIANYRGKEHQQFTPTFRLPMYGLKQQLELLSKKTKQTTPKTILRPARRRQTTKTLI